MNTDHLLKLTLALYRVTDCFPEKEPLRYVIREAGGRIYTAGIRGCVSSAFQKDIQLLKAYFQIAKAQNWVSQENFSVLESEYEKLSAFSKKKNVAHRDKALGSVMRMNHGRMEKSRKKSNNITVYSLQERKQKLIEAIRQEEKISLKDLLGKFPDVHRRTLIRDLDRLRREDLIKKERNGRGAFYFPNKGIEEKLGQLVTEEPISTQ